MLDIKKTWVCADKSIAELTNTNIDEIRVLCKGMKITPSYKIVDTCAAEFEVATPYYYSTYAQEDEVEAQINVKLVVLGSGPIRIGQGVEFDYCSNQFVWALRQMGIESIIVNNTNWKQLVQILILLTDCTLSH